MAAGLPVVATDASGIPEVITNDVHGVLCSTGDSSALMEAARFALSNPEAMRAMADRARTRVEEFSEEKMVEKTLALFGQMATSP
jgi:glycosyltransferase involved in cell wall biosynthesis